MIQFKLFPQICNLGGEDRFLAPEDDFVFQRSPADLVAGFIAIGDQLVEFRLRGIPRGHEILHGLDAMVGHIPDLF